MQQSKGRNFSNKITMNAGARVGLLTAAAWLLSACASATDELAFETDCDACPEMAYVEPGDFLMGRDGGEPDRYDGPVRAVSIAKPFWISRYEVTFAQFETFVEQSGYTPSSGCNVFLDDWWGWSETADWRNPGLAEASKPTDPVVCVSWDDAVAYTEWLKETTGLNYRLPTEAEWEYVARDGTSGEFAWEGGADNGCALANMYDISGSKRGIEVPWFSAYCDDGFAEASPVGSFEPNSRGVYDILGNVWEWTQDCYVLPYPEDGPTDGSAVEVEGECARRTVRGGSWETRPSRLVSAFRGRDDPAVGFRTFGIRVARDP